MSRDFPVTVAFIPRERFSIAAESLRSLLNGTRTPFRLLVVDCGIPAAYRREIDKLLAGRDGVDVLSVDHYLVPNESRNLAAANVVTPYVLFLENDMLLDGGCLDRMLATAEEMGADAVVPLLLEGRSRQVHFEAGVGCAEIEDVGGKHGLRIRRDFASLAALSGPVVLDIAESHLALYRTEALACAGLFDGRLRMNEFIDDSLSLRKAGGRLVLEPRARATFLPPPPVNADEAPFFSFRWEPESGMQAARLLMTKWQLDLLPSGLDLAGAAEFLRARGHQTSRLRWLAYVVRTRWRWPLGRVKNRLLKLLRLRR